MYVPGAKTLERLSRPLRTFLAPGGLILAYHRVADDAWDPLGLCTKPRHFREQLTLLARHFTPVPMSTLVGAVRDNRRTAGLAAVTFDDGYADFIEHALPMLRDADIPATVFVTTGSAGRPFWWDEISHTLGTAKPATKTLELQWGDPQHRFAIDADADPEELANSVKALCRELARAGDDERAAVLGKLRTWSDDCADPPQIPRALSEAGIRFLAGIDGIEIGCHTVSHPRLADMQIDAQRIEIETSREYLDKLLDGVPLRGFSYPNGSFSESTVSLVRHAGFDYACTSQQNVVYIRTDPYRLPRIWVPDLGGHEFRRWLSAWHGLRL